MDEATILESTYFDRCDILRTVKKKDEETGITENVTEAIYTNIPCAISKRDSMSEVLTGYIGSITSLNKLFLNPRYEIQLGDTVQVVLFNGKQDVYLASKPFFYSSHSETPLELKERS